jgi:hypothetical protein
MAALGSKQVRCDETLDARGVAAKPATDDGGACLVAGAIARMRGRVEVDGRP